MPIGSSLCRLKFHWCTVGILRCGSKTATGGALLNVTSGNVSCDEGLKVGAAISSGKPWAIRTSGATVQPAVVVPARVELHEPINPGGRPDTAVTSKDGSASKARP